ncbi:MAG: hypothetical protein P8011_05355 [Acidihalobacter sp.]|uniref:hypothetical protein n=1 Tax=Acidihalobacter sp. TaxID=1872108 RepID=UPI00307F5205
MFKFVNIKSIFTSLITISIFVSGCSLTAKKSPQLFQSYSNYRYSTNDKNIKIVAKNYFSKSLLGKDYKTNKDAESQLLFKSYMSKIATHYEAIYGENGCLVINGYDKENAPVIFKLTYILSDGKWLINNIDVVLAENKNDFVNTAKCSSEIPQ